MSHMTLSLHNNDLYNYIKTYTATGHVHCD